mmetsp:Transcript_25344/g.100067  ORF Transcript_25344/g.100067 Transcript_25344/m.100067 type:complete len:204 (+) Transcript_25344:2154-2765(+)
MLESCAAAFTSTVKLKRLIPSRSSCSDLGDTTLRLSVSAGLSLDFRGMAMSSTGIGYRSEPTSSSPLTPAPFAFLLDESSPILTWGVSSLAILASSRPDASESRPFNLGDGECPSSLTTTASGPLLSRSLVCLLRGSSSALGPVDIPGPVVIPLPVTSSSLAVIPKLLSLRGERLACSLSMPAIGTVSDGGVDFFFLMTRFSI